MRSFVRYILFVFVATVVMGCEYDFDLKGTHEVPMLVVDCMVNQGYGNGRKTLVCVSIYGTVPVGDYVPSSSKTEGTQAPVLDELEVSATVNGEEITLTRFEAPVGSDEAFPKDFFTAVIGDLTEGDVVEVHASAKGYPDAIGRTVAPGAAEVVSAEVSKDSILSVKINDNPATRDYYGIVLKREFEMHREISPEEGGGTEFVTGDYLDLLGLEIGNGLRTSIQPRLFSQLGFLSLAFSDNLVFFDDLSIKEQDNTFKAVVLEMKGAYYSGDYQLSVYKLSPEAYKFMRALYEINTGSMMAGISAVSYTYSGISGGFGAVGAYRKKDMVLPINY